MLVDPEDLDSIRAYAERIYYWIHIPNKENAGALARKVRKESLLWLNIDNTRVSFLHQGIKDAVRSDLL